MQNEDTASDTHTHTNTHTYTHTHTPAAGAAPLPAAAALGALTPHVLAMTMGGCGGTYVPAFLASNGSTAIVC